MVDKGIEKKTITIPEAAKMLGISKSYAYRAAKAGDIPMIQIGRRFLVPLAALEKKIEAAGA